MSKLTKFRAALTVTEASELLSKLINEAITAAEIEQLYKAQRIGMIFRVDATLMELTEEIPRANRLDTTRCFKESRKIAGKCLAIHMPSDDVYIQSEDGQALYRALVLRDTEGKFYSLVSNTEKHYFRCITDLPGYFPIFKDGFIEPSEIYNVAREANEETLSEKRNLAPKRNNWCCGAPEFYNFDPTESAVLPTSMSSQIASTFSFMTAELDAMRLAAEHFWTSYDINRPHLQKTVSSFIAERLGMESSNRKTDHLAAAIRPDDAPNER
jgi:hypothetical protein